MFRWLFKLILFIVLVALLYGLWLLYQEKTPEQKKALREKVARTFKGTGRTLTEAGQKVVEKGQQVYQEHQQEEKRD